MRIALISNMFPPDSDGGLEANAWKVAHGLRGRGHDVQVLCSKYRKGFVPASSEPEWVHRVFRMAPYWSNEWVGLRYKGHFLWALIAETVLLHLNRRVVDRWLEGREFDAVYCFGMSLIGTGTTLPFSDRGVPVLFHQGGAYLESRYLRRPPESIVLRLRRKLLAMELRVDLRFIAYVSRYLLEQAEAAGFFDEAGRGTGFKAVIPRGVDFEPAEDVDRVRDAPPTFLMAGRILRIKGFHNAVAAAALLLARRPELQWRLDVVGEPDNQDLENESGDTYLRGLETQIAEAGLGERVRFLGRKPREELLARMRSATAFVSASICGEGFANTIIETLGSGTPLIVSNDGSALEVVEHGRSALVFEQPDVETLSRHMELLLEDPILGMDLARGGVAVIRERYTLEKVLERTEEVLDEMVGLNRKRGILGEHG